MHGGRARARGLSDGCCAMQAMHGVAFPTFVEVCVGREADLI